MRDSVDFFGLNLKTIITGSVLVVLGFFLYWKIRGSAETKEELSKYAIITVIPFILFLVCLFLYNLFRSPYILYTEEYSKAQRCVEKEKGEKEKAESAVRAAETRVRELEEELTETKQKSSLPAERKTLTRPSTVPASQEPMLAHIRIASQKQIVSTDVNLPYGLQVVLQTDVSIQPVAFAIECDAEIGKGQAGFATGGMYTKTKFGLVEGHPNVFAFEWETPAFTPESPIQVNIFAKTQIRAAAFQQIPYIWP